MAFTRDIQWRPSFNMLRDDPARNYGIGSMHITFILKGDKGAVQWMIGTEWYIKSARDHLTKFPPYDQKHRPEGWDLGYHSPVARYEGQTAMDAHCPILGGECFYDGSGLNADLLIEGFLAGGTDWLWPALEEYYRHTFEDAPWPDFKPVYRQHPDDIKGAP